MTRAPQLGSLSIAIAADVTMREGRLALTDTELRKWRRLLAQVPRERRRAQASELLILAARFYRGAGALAGELVAQLLVLTGDVHAQRTGAPKCLE